MMVIAILAFLALSCIGPGQATPCSGTDQYELHDTDCTKYYHCSPSGAVEKTCPGNTIFHPTYGNCQWASDTCGALTIAGSFSCPACDAADANVCDGGDAQATHDTTCTKFFLCVHGSPVEKDCPGSTIWNPSSLTCDWPRDACANQPSGGGFSCTPCDSTK